MTDSVIMGGNWYVDTLNCGKRLESVQLPRLSRARDSFVQGGGWQSISIPQHVEDLEANVTMKGSHADIRGLFGREAGDWTTFYYYERLRDIMNGVNKGRVVTLKGLLQEVQQPRVTGKRADMTTYTIGSIVLYKDVTDGKTVHLLDYQNNKLVMNGADYSTAANQILAL